MAHFAQLDNTNTVTQVIVVNNSELMENGSESEQKGIEFCKSLFGADTNWVQTSYNGNIRKNYAGIGFTFDADKNAFIAPKPYASWVLNEETCQWQSPVVMPDDGKPYRWDEDTVSWVEVPSPYPSWILNPECRAYKPPVAYPQDGKGYQWNEEKVNWVAV